MVYTVVLICIILFSVVYLITRKKCKDKQEKVNAAYNDIMQLIAAMFTITGVTIISIFGPIVNMFPCKQIEDAENAIQQISVTQSKEYIESIIGPAKSHANIELPTMKGQSEKGWKSIYDNKYYLLICYYKNDNSLLGYFLVSKDKDFNPAEQDGTMVRILGDKKMFYNPINSVGNYDDKKRSTVLIGYRLNPLRADGSGYYMEYHYHHLGTRNLYIGVGQSEFGYTDNSNYLWQHWRNIKVEKYFKQYDYLQRNPFYFISTENDIADVIYNDISSEGEEPFLVHIKSEQVDTMFNLLPYGKTNVLSVLKNDDEINVVKLLSDELDGKMSLTRQEYLYLQ